MLIAILSDSHSDYANIERALKLVRSSGVTRVFHCGDITDARAAGMFAGFSVSFVLGNCDSDERLLEQAIEESGNQFCGRFGEVEPAGRRLAFVHGDRSATLREAEQSGRYELLCYGHTHVAEQHRSGPTLVVNPGALHRARTKTLALVDLETMECRHLPI